MNVLLNFTYYALFNLRIIVLFFFKWFFRASLKKFLILVQKIFHFKNNNGNLVLLNIVCNSCVSYISLILSFKKLFLPI